MIDLTAMPEPLPVRARLRFHGRGREYFGIWIVNLLLSVVTLGIYSAWAKVRTQRYFYGATELDGSRFDYHGKPLAILAGRAIALAFFVPYVLLRQVDPAASVAVVVVVAILMPWVIMRAMRFRLRVTSYRRLRFGFDTAPPTLKLAYRYYFWLPLLALPTLGLIIPYAQHQQYRWLVDRAHYGTARMRFRPAVGKFYLAWMVLLLILLAVATAAAVAATDLQLDRAFRRVQLPSGGDDADVWLVLASLLAGLFLYVGVIFLLLVFRLWLRKLAYDRISLEDVTIAAHYRPSRLLTLVFVNFLLILCTIGFAYPWVRCRTARYLLDNIEVTAPRGLDHFTAAAPESGSAVGDQVTSIFDVDVGIGI